MIRQAGAGTIMDENEVNGSVNKFPATNVTGNSLKISEGQDGQSS